MKKKTLAIILSSIMLLSLFPMTALGADIISGFCGADGDGRNVSWTLDRTSGRLVISGSGAMKNYEIASGGQAWTSEESIAPWISDETNDGNDIRSLYIENGVTSIGDNAFTGCFNLSSVSLGKDVNAFTFYPFIECPITDITVDTSNQDLSSKNGVLFNKSMTKLICYPPAKEGTRFEIPSGVTEIDSYAFPYYFYLNCIVLPEGITTITEGTFAADPLVGSTDALKEVYLPHSLTSIEEDAFAMNEGLKDIYYAGTREDWDKIKVGKSDSMNVETGEIGDLFESVTIHFSNGQATPSEPETPFTPEPGNPSSPTAPIFYNLDAEIAYTCTAGEMEWNPNSVGELHFSGTVRGPSQVRDLLIATWYDDTPPSETKINDDIDFYPPLWRDEDEDNGYSLSQTPPPFSIDNSRPIFSDDLGKTQYTLLLALNEDYACVGYALIPVTIPESLDEPLAPAPEQTSSTGFTDVEPGQWYCDGIEYAVENGMMNGVGEKLFNPHGTTTRAMVVTVLYRLTGEPYADSEGVPYNTYWGFDDVPADTWYETAVQWAYANDIVDGTSETTFSPDATITREQLAALLFRYALHEYNVVQQSTYYLSTFIDKEEISSFAEDALAWAVFNGIITGTGENMISPRGTATRAQVATILMRFCESIRDTLRASQGE